MKLTFKVAESREEITVKGESIQNLVWDFLNEITLVFGKVSDPRFFATLGRVLEAYENGEETPIEDGSFDFSAPEDSFSIILE